MYLRRRQFNPETRRIRAAGILCLSSGLMLTLLARGFTYRHPAIYDTLRLLLMGLGASLLSWSARRAQGFSSRH
jgi:hypothetical protein